MTEYCFYCHKSLTPNKFGKATYCYNHPNIQIEFKYRYIGIRLSPGNIYPCIRQFFEKTDYCQLKNNIYSQIELPDNYLIDNSLEDILQKISVIKTFK